MKALQISLFSSFQYKLICISLACLIILLLAFYKNFLSLSALIILFLALLIMLMCWLATYTVKVVADRGIIIERPWNQYQLHLESFTDIQHKAGILYSINFNDGSSFSFIGAYYFIVRIKETKEYEDHLTCKIKHFIK